MSNYHSFLIERYNEKEIFFLVATKNSYFFSLYLFELIKNEINGNNDESSLLIELTG